MNQMSINDVQNAILDILIFFDDYCKKNGFRYCLSGGTLLGAIRHKGFIPWDNDIDVCMARPDYEKLEHDFPAICDGKYTLRSLKRKNFNRPFLKMSDTRTLVDASYIKTTECDGLWIDIMPVDGLPINEELLSDIYRKVERYRWFLGISLAHYKFSGSTFLRSLLKPFAVLITGFIGYEYFANTIEKIAQEYPYGTSEYVGAITWGLYGTGERMLKSEFEKTVEVEFEGHKFPTFSCWDSYLRNLYGDYMQLPPPEKRISHDIQAYWKDE